MQYDDYCMHLKSVITTLLFPLAALLVATTEALANPPSIRPDLKVSTGLSRSDGLILDEEQNPVTNSSDFAKLIDVEAGVSAKPSQKTNATARYFYSRRDFDDTNDFDVDAHLLYTNLSYQWGNDSVGSSYLFSKTFLDGNEYYRLSEISPFYGRPVSKTKYLHVQIGVDEKEILSDPSRSADGFYVQGRLYFLINRLDNFVSLGVRYREENSDDAAFDSSSNHIAIAWGKKLVAFQKPVKTLWSLSWEEQDYQNGSTDDGRPRKDSQYDFTGEAEVGFSKNMFMKLLYRRLLNRSTDETLEYSQNQVDFMIGFRI